MSQEASYVARETGPRLLHGVSGALITGVAIAWSLFQLWYASPLPFLTARYLPVLNDTEARSIHLAFALFLGFVCFPWRKRLATDRVPVVDWMLGLAGAFSAGYLVLFYQDLAARPGLPTRLDLAISAAGMVLLLEATRRTLGPPLAIVALVFLAYIFFGHLAPDVIAWKGASFSRAMSHQWLTTEGVFGIALGVSTSFVFLFVLFGALLEQAGAGHYFIQVAFSLLGHLRGGPAKAAVLSSGLTGLVSGSSIANVVTTGTFTIPLMKRVGFPAEKAGAVEVAASVNGQIMPPVMGAAAFLMAEYVGISYVEVIRHALLPAVISYVALLYIVHLEALKAGMEGLNRRSPPRPMMVRLVRGGLVTASLFIVMGLGYYAMQGLGFVFGDAVSWVTGAGLVLLYGGLVAYAARHPDLPLDDPQADMVTLPDFGPTARTGLHFLIPIGILIWCLIVLRLSPGLSAFWACLAMMGVVVTQRPLMAVARGERRLGGFIGQGWRELMAGLDGGARNMIAIGIATAVAGIIVGTVSLTGIGQVMTELVDLLSGGNLLLMLVLVAALSLVLGMGLPTTANYIVVSALLAQVVVELGAQNGLVVPLVAVHMFVFYFGIMADVTPPVGLASFAAAAISGADPIRTGITSFYYSLRTVILPFMFIFNTKLLLIGIKGPADLVLTVFGATAAILVFSAATMGYFRTRSRWWESLLLLVVAFSLFRPGFWLDLVEPRHEMLSFQEAESYIAELPEGTSVRVVAQGETMRGDRVRRTVLLPVSGDAGPGGSPVLTRFEGAGLALRAEGARIFADDVGFASVAAKAGLDLDWEILAIERPRVRISAYWLYPPLLALLAGLFILQGRRRLILSRRPRLP